LQKTGPAIGHSDLMSTSHFTGRASNILPAPGLPTISSLWTKNHTLFSRYFPKMWFSSNLHRQKRST